MASAVAVLAARRSVPSTLLKPNLPLVFYAGVSSQSCPRFSPSVSDDFASAFACPGYDHQFMAASSTVASLSGNWRPFFGSLFHHVVLPGYRYLHKKNIGRAYRDGGVNVYSTMVNMRGSQFMIWNVQQPIQSLTSYSALLSSKRAQQESARKDVASQEDPFDSLTDKIPERPVTFVEGASYTVAICVGFAIAAAAAYAVFKELVFAPKEYKIFGKALERVQHDSQVKVRLGTPITGYGQETRNRAARQRIPNRVWTDEDGVERVEVQFYIRGPHGAGRVYSEMFRDKVDKKWKFTYLLVDVDSPSPTRLMLESYVPS